MFILQKSRFKSSREQIKIKGVKDNVLILPNNNYRILLEVSSLNFELKSEAEQDNLIDNYQNFLNSLPCDIQILFRVREVDLDKYLESFKNIAEKEINSTQRAQIKNYCEFVRRLISDNKILSRSFYIVLPYNPSEQTELEIASRQLKLLEDIVSKGLSKLGIKTRRLDNLEILDLFYGFYNPEKSKTQSITSQTLWLLEQTSL